MKFLRQAALLLPSAFLLDVLVFLLTHGRNDPGFGTFPFFQEWMGDRVASAAPELRFLEQALVFFLPAYVMSLLFILAIATAERSIFGPRKARKAGGFARAFSSTYPAFFLVGSALVMWFAERAALRQAPGALVAPLIAAAAPFAGAALAIAPAAALAGPVALLWKVSPA